VVENRAPPLAVAGKRVQRFAGALHKKENMTKKQFISPPVANRIMERAKGCEC